MRAEFVSLHLARGDFHETFTSHPYGVALIYVYFLNIFNLKIICIQIYASSSARGVDSNRNVPWIQLFLSSRWYICAMGDYSRTKLEFHLN